MSSELIKALQHVRELERMPNLHDAARLSNHALHVVAKDGVKVLAVKTLKVQLEDVQGDHVTIAFAFCDENDNVIVNVGRITMVGTGSTLTLANIANTLNFTVS